MLTPNKNFLKLSGNYLFAENARKIEAFERKTGKKALRLGIGDVTRPLASCVIEAMQKAAGEMGCADTFRGYGSEQGYDFLRKAISRYYAGRGVRVLADDIFISDGAKTDLGAITELFDRGNAVLLSDPSYPAYTDANVMSGRRIIAMRADENNGFLPLPDQNIDADVIYLCSPANPSGAAYTAGQLEKWVNYALKKRAVIVFDAAYECFIPYAFGSAAEENEKSGVKIPRSIYEIAGAEQCAIEICSFSKFAGFTGVRCGYTVLPAPLMRRGISLKEMWRRRQGAKFNGVSYITQRGAEAALSKDGMAQNLENVRFYMENARVLRSELENMNIVCFGGYAPYVWARVPAGYNGETWCERLLSDACVAATPGGGFGKNGENFVRFSAFCSRETIEKALKNIADTI